MQGLSDPSFFPIKKKPLPASDDEGLMSPALSNESMYSLMASFIGAGREYKGPLGMVEPGIKSMAQL